jgi:ABC-type antimicrobial peptide transport system permease subunit
MVVGAAAFRSDLQALLYGLNPLDPLSFTLAGSILVLVTALAIYLPARRALGMAPLDALRAGE